MRTSKDEYMLPNGTVISLWQDQQPPEGATIWNGYDYINQCWIRFGQPDTRTLEELEASIASPSTSNAR